VCKEEEKGKNGEGLNAAGAWGRRESERGKGVGCVEPREMREKKERGREKEGRAGCWRGRKKKRERKKRKIRGMRERVRERSRKREKNYIRNHNIKILSFYD
jgi:hypothetical protein